MYLEFTKMHGLGNDFMVVDLVTQRAYLDTVTIQRLADRHFGVGYIVTGKQYVYRDWETDRKSTRLNSSH